MALIKSISGIRGTIGGKPGGSLTPLDIVRFTAAYGTWLLQNTPKAAGKKVVIGRDGRISGRMVQKLVVSTLGALGLDVIDLGLSTTPTVEMAVKFEKAIGGIIITASHNPKEWNALKLLNGKGEFISGADGEKLLAIADKDAYTFCSVDKLGTYTKHTTGLRHHIDAILHHPLVDVYAIRKAKFRIAIDAINSTGATAVPALLKELGVREFTVLNGAVNGQFAHNPEPLPQHLRTLCKYVKSHRVGMGIAVDPDVDRLCFVCEDGSLFGEEYTLVAIADYVLSYKKGNTVSNMSSTRALKDVTLKHGGQYFPSAVGEVNVVQKMKKVKAVIGGEGNGGVIVPDLHYGRDALIGIALFLSFLAKEKKSVKQLRSTYPNYFMSKNKIELKKGVDVKKIFDAIKKKYKKNPINTEDGLKIEFGNDWVHLRTSNTEPIIRIYSESSSEEKADELAGLIIKNIQDLM